MKTHPNEPSTGYGFCTADGTSEWQGLTKREYFAAMALTCLCNEGAFSKTIQQQSESVGVTSSQSLATYAVDLADALIVALNQQP